MFPLGEATQAVSPSPRLLDFFHSPRAGIVEKTGYRYPRISEKTDAGTSPALLLAPGTSTSGHVIAALFSPWTAPNPVQSVPPVMSSPA